MSLPYETIDLVCKLEAHTSQKFNDHAKDIVERIIRLGVADTSRFTGEPLSLTTLRKYIKTRINSVIDKLANEQPMDTLLVNPNLVRDFIYGDQGSAEFIKLDSKERGSVLIYLSALIQVVIKELVFMARHVTAHGMSMFFGDPGAGNDTMLCRGHLDAAIEEDITGTFGLFVD